MPLSGFESPQEYPILRQRRRSKPCRDIKRLRPSAAARGGGVKTILPRVYLGSILALGVPLAWGSTDDSSPLAEHLISGRSIWEQPYLFGDWGGARTQLRDRGITFDLNHIGDLQTDASGSQTHHASYFGRIRASVDINGEKLADMNGELFVSGVWQYGRNHSERYLHVNTLTSSIAGVQSLRVDQFWYQHGLFEHQITVKLGQVAAVNEFGATDFFDILFNDELGYAPNALFSAKQPFSPAGKPGVVIWGDLSVLTPGLYAKAGIFTAYDNPYRPDDHGFDYVDDFSHGAVTSFEIGYQEKTAPYAAVYKLGINLHNLVINSGPHTGQTYKGNLTAYALAQKSVYHPMNGRGQLDLKRGFDALLEVVGSPGDRNPLAFEITAGGRYTGLIPGRDQDKLGLGIIYSRNGSAYSDAYRVTKGHGLAGETTLELDYQYNPSSWVSLQLDSQYIIDPGGDAQRSGILLLGVRTILRF